MNARYKSLDVFRGITVAGMILVNTPGSWAYIYPPLQHADWHGYTPTDLVFPFFLIAVGLSMSFSFRRLEGLNNKAFYLKAFRRALLIFLIGLALTAFPFFGKDYANLRILGVLQRIALAYLSAAIVVHIVRRPLHLTILASIVLIGYWLLLLFFGSDDPYSLEGNLPRKIDLLILEDAHMWHGKKIAFDPEGLLSTLPAMVTVISGYLFGLMIQRFQKTELITRLAAISTILLVVGYIWSLVMPINKALWTSSYVLVSSGIGGLVLTLLIYFIDFKKMDKWSWPFEVFGMNPLVSFVASILWVKIYFLIDIDGQNLYGWLYTTVFKPIVSPTFGSLLFAIAHVFGCWLIALWLYKRKIIIKI